jgi:Protein of unknown function (DUF4231)
MKEEFAVTSRSCKTWKLRTGRKFRMTADPITERLDHQIEWYSARSEGNQRRYKTLKITVIILAALIPLLSGLDIPYIAPTGVPKSFLGLLGALIAIIEGLQQVNQHHATWISYRSTAEALKRERFLYLGKAGPYLAVPDARILLAERVEGIVSQERAANYQDCEWSGAPQLVARLREHPANDLSRLGT